MQRSVHSFQHARFVGYIPANHAACRGNPGMDPTRGGRLGKKKRWDNKSQSAIKVSDVHLNLELDSQEIIEPAKNFTTSLAVIEGDKHEEIPPFGDID
ncbi:hypothetical protein [Streptomyces sp. NPDC058394]|uniref:hypothetical protein n=1 Tax=unclassified Streptomyces TaxID=2593676 RepID=UPI00364B0F2C